MVEKIKTRILKSSVLIFENYADDEIKWNNSVQPGKQQKKIWRMSIEC
jgi:hypothetical protein